MAPHPSPMLQFLSAIKTMFVAPYSPSFKSSHLRWHRSISLIESSFIDGWMRNGVYASKNSHTSWDVQAVCKSCSLLIFLLVVKSGVLYSVELLQ